MKKMHKVDEKLTVLREQFREYYNNNLKTDYEAIEEERKTKAMIFYVSALFGLFFSLFVFKLSFLNGNKIQDINVLLLFFFFYIFYFWCKCLFIVFKKNIKELLGNKLLAFFSDVTNIEDKQIIQDNFYISNIYPKKRFHPIVDDIFLIKRNNNNVYVSDLRVEYSGKVNETVFKGIGILVGCTKKFKGKTVVMIKNNIFSLFVKFLISFVFSAILATKLGHDFIFVKKYFIYFWLGLMVFFYLLMYYIPYIRNFFQKRRGVSLEDVVFAKNWDISTTDQVEARYLLTPTLMNNILSIKKLYGGKSVEFSFFDNKFFILINTEKDMFETISLFRKADDVDRVFKVVEQFYSIFQIIDLLKIEGKKNNEKS